MYRIYRIYNHQTYRVPGFEHIDYSEQLALVCFVTLDAVKVPPLRLPQQRDVRLLLLVYLRRQKGGIGKKGFEKKLDFRIGFLIVGAATIQIRHL